MRLILFLSLFLICSTAYAANYIIEHQDGSVSILNHIDESDPLENVILKNGWNPKSVHLVKSGDLPSDKSDRKYWKVNEVPIGGKIVIDQVKKQADLDAEADKQQKKDKVLQKLGITETELKELLV